MENYIIFRKKKKLLSSCFRFDQFRFLLWNCWKVCLQLEILFWGEKKTQTSNDKNCFDKSSLHTFKTIDIEQQL